MGNRLNSPKFMVISAIIGKIELKFCFATLPIAAVTPTGPETALIPYFPPIKSNSDLYITAQYEADILKVCPIKLTNVFFFPYTLKSTLK